MYMRKKIAVLILTSFLIFCTVPAAPAGIQPGSKIIQDYIYLKAGKIKPEPAPFPGILKQLENLLGSGNAKTKDLYIIQLKGPVVDSWKEQLSSRGAVLGDYIPDFAFLAQMNPDTRKAVESLDFVTSVAVYKPEYKYSNQLKSGADGKTTLKISLFGPGGKSIVKTVTGAMIDELAKDSNIVFMEPVPDFKIFNDKAGAVIGAPAAWNNSLQGQGQVVGIADTGLDSGVNDSSMHRDLQGRVKAIYSINGSSTADTNGHGTHVAGSLLGSGAMSNGQVKGIAPQAQLVFQAVASPNGGLNIPADLAQLFSQAYTAGARVHSDSWGSGKNTYDYTAQSVDRFIWNNNDMAILFAAGNNGDYNGDGYPNYGTISSPATAKNVIAVGASENNRPEMGTISDNINRVAFFSSRGNTSDGRLKPDIVTPGSSILSTESGRAPGSGPYNNAYTYMSGTSMATPLTAGAVTLIRQYYTDKLGVTPKPSLLKATLINGAQDMGYGYPSRDQGWGRTNLAKLFPAAPETLKFDNESIALSTGGVKDYTYTVTSSGTPLKISLVWTDYPGSTTASKALVNDLDLTVTGPDGTAYHGNDFAAPFNDSADRLNNVENVFIKSPAPGNYRVTVKGYNIPNGPQKYSLVVSGAMGSIAPAPSPAPVPVPSPAPSPATEPTPAPAPSLTQTVNITQTGYLSSTNTTKYKLFYIDVNQPGQVSLHLKWGATATDLDLYLFDPAWVQVAKSNAKANPEVITFNATKTGRYCIKVNAYSGDASYILTINQTVSTAKTAVMSATGRVDVVSAPEKYYDLTVGTAGSVNIQVSFNNTNQSDIDIFLYDSAGTLVSKGTSPYYRVPESLSFPVDKHGKYRLKVKAYRGASDYKMQAVYPK